jgi:hypothetical protein
VGTKAADIIVYTDDTKETPKIIVECKKPKHKDAIEQLKSYMNAKGAPVTVWSNGRDSINVFGPDVSSLDPKTWYETGSGKALMHGLRGKKLTIKKIPPNETLKDEDDAREYFENLKFDVILTNPPFAGEMKDRKMLARQGQGSQGKTRRALHRAGAQDAQARGPGRYRAAPGDLVRTSLDKLEESKRLLDQAKSRVEQLIEEAASR